MQESFYRLSKGLFTEERYRDLTLDAKILYSILIDRMELSAYNGWKDEKGRLYLYYTTDQVCAVMRCGNNKTVRMFRELEEADLIYRVRRGLGKSSIIYPKKIQYSKEEFQKCQNDISGSVITGSQEVSKWEGSNTEYNNTEYSDTESSSSDEAEEIEEQIKYQIDYDILAERGDRRKLDELVGIITGLLCIRSPTVRIGRNEYSRSIVEMNMKKLRAKHIELVLERMNENRTRIHNIRAYLEMMLFQASATTDHYYQMESGSDNVC